MLSGVTIGVISPFYPPVVGGLASHAAQFDVEMARRCSGVCVFTPRVVAAPWRETSAGVTVVRFPAVEIVANYPLPAIWRRHFWQQWRLWRRCEPNIVISRTRFFLTCLLAWGYARRRRVPWLHVEHGADFVQAESSHVKVLARLYDATLGSAVLRQADAVVANSKASAAFITRLAGGRNPLVIYRGLHLPDLSLAQPARTIDILYAGRLIEGKGVADLLNALAQLTDAQKLAITIVGEGPDARRLRHTARQLGLNTVLWSGFLTSQDLFSLLRKTRVFVNPSLSEGIPSSVIEALAAGCRVVATDVGGTREILEGEGLHLVAARSPAALAKALENAFHKAPPPTNTAKILRERFSWRTAGNQYEQIISRLI